MMMIRPKRSKTSYREQFLSRQSTNNMEQPLSTVASGKVKAGPISILKKSNIPLRKKSNERPRYSISNQVVDVSDKRHVDVEKYISKYANPEFEEDKKEKVAGKQQKLGIGDTLSMAPEMLLDLGIGGMYSNSQDEEYRRMMSQYANVFDLHGIERQYLGLDRTNEPSETPSSPRKVKSSSGDNHNQSSTWTSIFKQFPLDSWLGNAFTSANPPDNNIDNNTALHNANSDYSVVDAGGEVEQEQTCESEEDHCDKFPLCVLNLMNRVCEDNHMDDDIGNCFKCQFMESFKSFTMEYLTQLECVWGNTRLSLREQEERLNEILQMWIFHLSEQNVSLAESYNESIRASDKLKSALIEARNSKRTLRKEHEKCKACNDALYYELSLRDSSIKKLRNDKEIVVEQMREMEETLQDAQSDKDSLTELLSRLRDKGVWDISGLPLTNATYRKIFLGNYYLHGAKVVGQKEFSSKKREWKDEIDQLKGEMETLRILLATKEKEIKRFKCPKK